MEGSIATAICRRIADNIETVMRGQFAAIRKLLAGFVGGGHVLLEDYPGTGKTTLAKALAKSMDVIFKRIQFTPDLLPSDILGVSIYNQKDNAFRFHKGPIFSNIALADEINRASPRTQSALLESMAEGQVSVDGEVHQLDKPFFVIATQNPVETHGTYPLPEAQMDRFMLKFNLGYVSADEETRMLSDQRKVHPIDSLKACVTRSDVLFVQEQVKEIQISEELRRYCVNVAAATRSAPGVKLGASPRGSLALMRTASALALFDGSDFVTPEHIQEIAVAVLAHRIVLEPQERFAGVTAEDIVRGVLKNISVPA